MQKHSIRVRRRNHINKIKFPDSNCSSPVSGSTIGSRSRNSQSRSHDTQVTNSKNKANSKDYEDGNVVSRVTEEAQSHGNKSRQRYKRKRKNISLGTETSNSCSRISDLVSVTHGCDNTVCLRNGSSLSPKVSNRKVRRSRWRKRKSRDFHPADKIKRDVHPESSAKRSDSNKCSNPAMPNKTNISSEMSLVHTNMRSLGNSHKDHREASAVEGVPRLLTIGPKEGMSVHDRPHSFYEDSACFSFQKENEPAQNEISANLCGEESKLDIKDGVASQGTEALNCENTHADAVTGQEKDDAPDDATENQDESVNLTVSLTTEKLLSTYRKKLLVLDLNGLLADIILYFRRAHKSYTRVGEYLGQVLLI